MKVIVGSKALEMFAHWANRVPNDIDIWTDETHAKKPQIKGIEISHVPLDILNLIPTIHKRATPDAIYTIKRSHAMYDIYWDKTISDIIWLQRKGCKLIPELHTSLCKYWKKVHGNKNFLNLNRTKKEFFDDYVKKEYDHDLLHVIVACSPEHVGLLSKPPSSLTCFEREQVGNNLPMYTNILKDGQEVLLDYQKFMQLSNANKLKLFREEIYVIALERWLIPSNFRISKPQAYRWALKKAITKLTKNWATQFILDNIEEYIKMGGTDWYKNFYKHIGKEVKMHSTIFKIKTKAEELQLEDTNIKEALGMGGGVGANSITQPNPEDKYYKDYPEEFEKDEKVYEFVKFLNSLGFKEIEQAGGEDQGTSAYSVIELEGKLFRSDYSYASYDGYYIDDVWEWREVQAQQKTVTIYE